MCFLLNYYGQIVFGECGTAISLKEKIKLNFEIIGKYSEEISKHIWPSIFSSPCKLELEHSVCHSVT